VLGGIDCFNPEMLHQLADKATQLYGDGHDARNISVASIGSLGSIIGQLIHVALLYIQKKKKMHPLRAEG